MRVFTDFSYFFFYSSSIEIKKKKKLSKPFFVEPLSFIIIRKYFDKRKNSQLLVYPYLFWKIKINVSIIIILGNIRWLFLKKVNILSIIFCCNLRMEKCFLFQRLYRRCGQYSFKSWKLCKLFKDSLDSLLTNLLNF